MAGERRRSPSGKVNVSGSLPVTLSNLGERKMGWVVFVLINCMSGTRTKDGTFHFLRGLRCLLAFPVKEKAKENKLTQWSAFLLHSLLKKADRSYSL